MYMSEVANCPGALAGRHLQGCVFKRTVALQINRFTLPRYSGRQYEVTISPCSQELTLLSWHLKF